MRSFIVFALFALSVGMCASGGHTQDRPATSDPAPAPSRFAASMYAGGSWTSSWLEAKDYDFGIGYSPVVGASVTAWITPQVGLRLHGAYLAVNLPEAEGVDSIPDSGRPLNVWLYDLDLMGRPFATRADVSRQISSVYFWIGAGALTVDPAGEGRPEEMGCVFPYYLGNACLSYSGHDGTVGQVTAGTGMDLLYLGDHLSVFGEVGLHGYGSPFHTGPGWTGRALEPGCRCDAEDINALTARLVIGAKLEPRRAAPAAAAVAVKPLPLPPPPPPLPPAPEERPIEVCVTVNGIPQYVDAIVLPESGDTAVAANGVQRPLRTAYPSAAGSAAAEVWFVNNEDVFLLGRPYVKFGMPRSVEPAELTRVTEYDGIPIFRLSDEDGETPGTVYLPTSDGCQFQPYQMGDWVRRVRG